VAGKTSRYYLETKNKRQVFLRIRYSTSKDGRPVKKAVVYTQDEHRINMKDVDFDAIRTIEKLKSFGHDAYIVGGAVRDLMLGKTPKDFDIVTDASPSRIKKIFRNSRVIGRRFRLVHVFYGEKIFEVSTFRSLSDGTAGNTFGTIDEDVQRRDFSLNAFFYDPIEQIVIDYVDGMKDLKARRLRPIIPLPIIFKDDPVRMIRAVKYAALTGFKIPFQLKRQIKKDAPLLASISPSRLTEEMFKIINSVHSSVIVEHLDDFGLYQSLQPAASKMMKANPEFKKNYIDGFVLTPEIIKETKSLPGSSVISLIRDYIETVIDWSSASNETYREAFALARNFVLPINPPRIQIEKALRRIFKDHAIVVKKARTGIPQGTAQERDGKPRPRRRKRGKKPASSNNEQ
jgi:poly(A) polymerase